jgi:hypothetical protein
MSGANARAEFAGFVAHSCTHQPKSPFALEPNPRFISILSQLIKSCYNS